MLDSIPASPIKSPLDFTVIGLASIGYNLYLIGLQAMHQGVVRDMEQQRIKKERQADFDMQKALEEEYLKIQQVHDSVEGSGGSTKG